jgi:putative DNA primase/helicase
MSLADDPNWRWDAASRHWERVTPPPSKRRRGGIAATPDKPLTEDEVALRFATDHAADFRYCHDRGAWLKWDDSIWRQDKVHLAYHYARELARELAKSADTKTIFSAGRAAFAAGVERLARADPTFARTSEAWDADPWLAGCPGGVLNLRTGLVERADPAHGITKSLAVAPADKADCPQWLAFVDHTFGRDLGLIRFVQQYVGYSLTGDVSEHALVFGYGAGGNGKGVLLNTVAGILGDYALTAAMDTFTASRGDKHPTDLAMLAGARFVTASETEDGKAWAEARIKQLTGGDPIQARFMRRDFFQFRPAFKLFIVGNHRPELRNVDNATRRRFNVVPFDYRPERPDPDLERKLRSEWPAILRWVIDGCLDWQANRLVRPASVLAATETYFHDQDLFGQWLEDECDAEPDNTHKWDQSSALFKSWKAYAEGAGDQAGTTKTFAEAMRRRGFRDDRTSKMRLWRGIQLRRPHSDR